MCLQGLVETFKQLMPGVEHRFYVKHLYANFKRLYKGKELERLGVGCSPCLYSPRMGGEPRPSIKMHMIGWLRNQPVGEVGPCSVALSVKCWQTTFTTGIPCPHAMAAILVDKRQPRHFVHEYYHRETYMRSCAPNNCPNTDLDRIMPPT